MYYNKNFKNMLNQLFFLLVRILIVNIFDFNNYLNFLQKNKFNFYN